MTAVGYLDSPRDVREGGGGDLWKNIKVQDQAKAEIGHRYNFYIGSGSSRRTKSPTAKNLAIMAWLSPMNFHERYSDISRRWQPGTGEWFLQTEEFDAWAVGTQRFLWCPGIPGAGKSVISSRVIDHLNKRYHEQNVGVAFIFCDHKMDAKQQTAENFISGITKQFLQTQARKTAPSKIASSYDTHTTHQTRPGLTECSELLGAVVDSLGLTRLFIVIDALDECSERVGRAVVHTLESFKPVPAHLLVTSRLEPRVERLCGSWPKREIFAQEQDIELYLDAHIEDEGELAYVVQDDPDLRETVIKTIVQRSQGMFLLAERHLASLVNEDNHEDVMAALETLPRTLFDSYDETWQRIQKDPRSRRVKQILSWISYSPRPLHIRELQHALATSPELREMNSKRLPPVDALPSACYGLVILDHTSAVIRMVHKSAEDYFLDRRKRYFPDAQRDIALACLTYLSFDAFKDINCGSERALEALIQDESNALLQYAAQNWGLHAYGEGDGAIEREIQEPILQFLSGDTLACAAQVMLLPEFRLPGYRERLVMEVTNVHMTAYFGLAYSMKRLCESRPELNKDPEDTHGRTPLCWAAEKGFVEVVDLLLCDRKVDINSQDRHGRGPLSWAARYGRARVVERLLQNADIEINIRDERGLTPLALAARNGHDTAVGVLLRNTAIAPDAGDIYSQTPLSWAAGNGHETVVRQLLQSAAVDINSQSMYWRTPLSWAAQNGHDVVMNVLLAHPNVDPDLADSYRRTPLYHAAEHGQVSVVKLLLETDGVDADCKTIWNTTPLWAAQSGGHDRVVELLEKKAKVKTQLDANPASPKPQQSPTAISYSDYYCFSLRDSAVQAKGFHPTERQTLRPDDRWVVIDRGMAMGMGMEMDQQKQPSWRLLIRSSGWAAGVSYTNVTGAVFIVVLGIHNSSVWCSIATGVEHETLEDVINSYYPSVRPKVLRTDSGTDYVSKSVAEGAVATLCISKDTDIEWGYFVDVGMKSVL